MSHSVYNIKSRMKLICSVLFVLMLHTETFAKKISMASPNHGVKICYKAGTCSVTFRNKHVIDFSINGFSNKTAISEFRFIRKISEQYTMKAGKRKICRNEANEYIADISENHQAVIRVYNDGIAFRNSYSGLNDATAPDEQTEFRIPEGTNRWMQQWADSYEGFYPLSDSYKQLPVPSYSGISKSEEGWNNRWGFPALLQTDSNTFALITEADIDRNQSSSCLFNDKEIYKVVPDKNEVKITGEWKSPWRVIITGTLADIVESTLVTDIATPSKIANEEWIQPGVVSWIYWAYNHGSNDFKIICQYVDMAKRLRLPYVLIDAEWDQMKDGYTILDAIEYANKNGVKPLIWYNSSVGWVDGAPTPKYRLNKAEDREHEFQWCADHGVAGVKIDFFSGDNQSNMDYCIDLLESAARHQLLVNFHGATIPRGWQRTWPNLMTTEAVYGAEWYNNVPTFTSKAASHNATLPFTRNVIGPMDYTPCTFSDSQHPHITSKAHELALTVLFESGLQHLADKPESYYAQPQEVQQFLSELPTVWDDTKFIAGYPGEYVVIARKSNSKWYVAGINGTDNNKVIPINLKPIINKEKNAITFFDAADGNDGWDISSIPAKQLPKTISCIPRGGFLIIIDSN